MSFRRLVNSVQRYSGFSTQESKDALELMVESIAVRLEENKRKEFASELPEMLSDIALSVLPSEENSTGKIVDQFMTYEDLGLERAKKLMEAAWRALVDNISETQLNMLKPNLSQSGIPALN